MALGWTALSAPTVIFLVPTFMLYIWFASSDPNAQLTLAQSKSLNLNVINHQQSIVDATATATALVMQRMQSRSIEMHQRNNSVSQNTNNYNRDNSNSKNKASLETSNYQSKSPKKAKESGVPDIVGVVIEDGNATTTTTQDKLNALANDVDSKPKLDGIATGSVGSDDGDVNGDGGVDDDYQAMQAFQAPSFRSQRTGQTIREHTDTVDHIIRTGLFNSTHVRNPRKLFKRALAIALIGSILDEIMLILSQCLVDTSFLCDDSN